MAEVLNLTLNEGNRDCSSSEYRNLRTRTSYIQVNQKPHLSTENAAEKTSFCDLNGSLKKGDKVLVHGSALERKGNRNYFGTVQYVSQTDDNLTGPKNHVGVCLYDNVYSSHNGVYHGKRYFFCPRGHGAMVKSSDVKPISPVLRTWPLSTNHMFPSYEGVKRRRKLREQLIKEAEEMLYKEYEIKRRAQTERLSKSAKLLSSSDQDFLTRGNKKLTHGVSEESFEELQLQKLKKAFGGDEKAERMIQTLKKLRRAFEEGLAITSAEKGLME